MWMREGLATLSETTTADEVRGQTAGMTSAQKRALIKEINGEIRTCKAEIRALQRKRTDKLAQIRRECSSARRTVREKMRALREEFLRRQAVLKADDARVRRECVSEVAKLQAEISSSLGPKEALLKRLDALRARIKGLSGGASSGRSKAGNKAREAREESDEMTGNDIAGVMPGAGSWWQQKGRHLRQFKQKNVPKKTSRAEHVLQYLEHHPEVLYEWQEQQAEKLLAEKIKEEKALQKKLAEKQKLKPAQQARRRMTTQRTTRRMKRGYARPTDAPF